MTRTVCLEVRRSTGEPCDLADHPQPVHASWVSGWLQPWSNPQEGEEWRNVRIIHTNVQAPEALK